MIISDSTTLIILNNLNRLDLLEIFEKIYIPQKVYEEINYKNDFSLPKFIEILEVKNNELYHYLIKILDAGESEAISLAKEKDLPLIIDEKKGRKIAKNLKVKIIGFLGILYLNYKKDTLSKTEIENILEKSILNGYRISTKLINEFFENL